MSAVGTVAMTKNADGTMHIERADERILVALDLVQAADRRWLEATGNYLIFRGANRLVEYFVTGYDPVAGGLICERLP